jgi:protocatechuate 3,4-dioxygenase beta subunit
MKRLALVLLLLAPAALARDLEGYVYTLDGKLAPNVNVAAYLPAPSPETREMVKKLTTDERGHFKFTGLPDDALIELEAGGTVVTALPGDTTLTITSNPSPDLRPPSPRLPGRGAGDEGPPNRTGERAIEGTIRIGKKPIRGVIVSVEPMSENASRYVSVVTDEKGRYRVTGLAPARYMVNAAQGLYIRLRPPWWNRMFDERRAPNVVDVEEERSGSLDIELTPAPLITGRVVDHEKKPVAGAAVGLMPENAYAGRIGYDPQSMTRTLPDGRFVVPTPGFTETDRVQVFVVRPHHSLVPSKPFAFGNGGQNIEITLPKFDPIPVRVTGADGKPLRGASVSFTAGGMYRAETMSSIAPVMAADGQQTNDAGEATLHLLPGEYDFIVNAPKHQTKTVYAQKVKSGSVINVALEPAYTIRGRVHRAGKGVPGVFVGVARDRRDQTIVTDANGAFEITGLAKETYPLMFLKPEEMIDRTMDVAAPAELEVELPPAGTILGRVIDAATREPVREFMLAVEPLDSANTNARANARRRGPAGLERNEQTDGTFSANVPVGRYRVTVTAIGYTASDPVDVQVIEQQPARVEIVLDRGATINGIVTDESGVPVREAAVWLIGEAVQAAQRTSPMRNTPRVVPISGRTDARGVYSLSGIEPGQAVLMVRREGFVPSRRDLDVQGSMTVDVRLSRGVTVTGTVTRNGQPVAEAHVNAGTAAVEGEHQSVATDERGRFTMQGLIEARYSFSAFKEGIGHVEVPNVDVARQREVNIELESAPRSVIYGTVTGFPRMEGKIVRRAVLAQSDQHSAEGTIDENGHYRIENAPTGMVQITAHVDAMSGGRTSARKQLEIAPRQEVRVDLDFGGAVLVRGRVTQDGRPVRHARVIFTTETGIISSAMSREDGLYEIALAEPGTYRVFVHGEEVRNRAFHTTRTIRDNTTIDLDIREQVLEGVVLDAESRQPIAGAIVTLQPQEGSRNYVSGETITDAGGRFTISVSVDGPHVAFASARGYAFRTQSLTLGTSTRIAPLTFELPRTSELRVRTIDARTRNALGAHIVVSDLRGTPLPVRGEQSPDAMHWIFYLPAGKYRVTANVQGYASKTIEANAPGSVDVVME